MLKYFCYLIPFLFFLASIPLIYVPFALVIKENDILESVRMSIIRTRGNILQIIVIQSLAILPILLVWGVILYLVTVLSQPDNAEWLVALHHQGVISSFFTLIFVIARWASIGAIYKEIKPPERRKSTL